MKIIWIILQAWLAIYLVLPFFYLVVYFIKKAFRAVFNIYSKKTVFKTDFDFAAIITAHKDSLLIPPLVDSLLKQEFQNIIIYIVADACDDISLLTYNTDKVVVLKPEKALNSKIRSIDYAVSHFKRQHDALVIFDPDNLVHPQFFSFLNIYFQKGFSVVQTNLLPKNTDSIYARLDSIGVIFYNFTEREIRMELGLSSSIWGSGIAVSTALYKKITYNSFFGGFDKRMQAFLVQNNSQLAFAKEALVYDEKVSSSRELENQRTRWIHAYFKYFFLNLGIIFTGMKRMNFNLIFFGFITLRPPFFMVIFLAFIFTVISYIHNPGFFIAWLIVIGLFLISFFSIINTRSINKGTRRSIFLLPLLMFHQLFALTKLRRAGKTFIKTEHTKLVYIEDVLGNK